MKMYLRFSSFVISLWIAIFEVHCQIQYLPGNGGCGGCQQTDQNVYSPVYPWYPQISQQYVQYPYYSQQYQQYTPYVYPYNQQQVTYTQQYVPTNQQTSSSYATGSGLTASTSTTGNNNNQYNNVKTEIVDIDPAQFRYLYANYFPVSNSRRPASTGKVVRSRTSPYVVKVDSHQYNNTNVPQVIKKHDVQHKVFTFKKTYTLKPGEKDQVINLNFVNGVPVTTGNPEREIEETTPPRKIEPPSTERLVVTTTEDDNPYKPGKGGRKFLDIPESCPEGTTFIEGKCWKKFSLTVQDPSYITNATKRSDIL